MEQAMIEYLMGLMPNNTGSTVQNIVENRLRFEIKEYKERIISEFCQTHDLCPICITGGFSCGSDHK